VAAGVSLHATELLAGTARQDQSERLEQLAERFLR